MDVQRALGEIALGTDIGPCEKHRHKFADLGPDGDVRFLVKEVEQRETKETMHMLLSLVLDLWRKNEYLYMACREFAERADPEQAARMAVHNDLLNEFDAAEKIDWRGRAHCAATILHRLLEDTEDEHREVLDRLSGGVRERVEREERARMPTLGQGA